MKKNVLITLAVFAFSMLLYTGSYAQQKTDAIKDKDDDNDFYVNNFRGKAGEWDAVIKNDRIHIEFAGRSWNSGRRFLLSEFTALPTGTAGTFKLQREAGTIVFSGVFNNNKGEGTYKFEENPDFKTFLAGQGFTNIKEEFMLNIFFTDINKAYFDYLKTNGYTGLTMNQFRDLAQQNINRKVLEEYFNLFAKQNYGKVSIDKIVELCEHGVDVEFVNSFSEGGYKSVSLDQALTLRDHGVDMDFIKDFKVKDMTLEQATDLRDHGVDPEYMNSLTSLGWKDMSLESAIDLRDHGVSVSFVKEIMAAGYKDISPEKAMNLVDHGVSASYIKELNDLGWKNISLETTEDLRNHGVNTSFIKELQALGYKDLNADKAIELRDHGVSASFINGFKSVGFADITLDKAQELHDHGVTADYIKKMKQKGLNNLSLDEYQKLKDAGM